MCRYGVCGLGRRSARRPLSTTLLSFLCAVGCTGSLILAFCLITLPDTPLPLGWLLVSLLALAAGWFALKMPGVPVYPSISDTFHITSCLLFGPAPATLTIALDSLVMSVRRGNPTHQILFNTTSCAISLVDCRASVLLAVRAPARSSRRRGPRCRHDGCACWPWRSVYFVLQFRARSPLRSHCSRGSPSCRSGAQHFAIVAFSHLAAGSASFVLLVLAARSQSDRTRRGAAAARHLSTGDAIVGGSARRRGDARGEGDELHLSTVSALATAIEAKDGVTSDHIHRVRAYALGLARALDITDPSMLQAIEAAGLLHDTGKIAIPEHILNKPGKLTPSEFETMKTHVDIGADILSSIDFPYPVIPIVRAHHENWNGTGYPAGLRGEDIPIGARILSVVDCFDALTIDRPYRPAMTAGEADAISVGAARLDVRPGGGGHVSSGARQIEVAAPTAAAAEGHGAYPTARRETRRRCRRRSP